MHLQFLGTAAAEGYPGIFCNCDNCNEARALGGKSLRFRSALLINDDLLIDFGPDLLAAAFRFNRNLSLVTTALITHAHSDHFYLSNFAMRGKAFTGSRSIPTLRVYGPSDAFQALLNEFPDPDLVKIDPHPVQAFDAWEHNGYRFQAYRAYHAVDHLDALFYSIEQGSRAVLYATDTGAFPEETWQALQGRSFDAVILEETLGDGTYTQHLGFQSFLEHAARLKSAGILRPGGKLIAHHLSHSGNPTHEKVEAILNPHGVEVAYDGMEVLLP